MSIPLSVQEIELTPKVETLEEIVISNKKRVGKNLGWGIHLEVEQYSQ